MYQLVKVRSKLTFPSVKLKNYVHSAPLEVESKQKLAKELILDQYNQYVHKTVGSFVGIKSVNVLEITTGAVNYDYCGMVLEGELYFYKVSPKEIVDCVVTKVTPNAVWGSCFGYLVQIPLDHLSTTTPSYNAALNIIQVGQKKIKEQDILRIRVTSIQNPLTPLHPYLIKGTCRSAGSGKIVKP